MYREPCKREIHTFKLPEFKQIAQRSAHVQVGQTYVLAWSMLRRVAVCCGVLRCVTVCCSVLQCVAVCCSVLRCVRCVAVGCGVM